LQRGDRIVWHAAAGGVGSIACQWAKALGLELIATAGSPEKCARAKQLGAAHAIDYRREDVVARVKQITGGRGVKVVYDSVGKDTFDRSLACLAPLGLLVSFGNASGPPPPLDVLELMRRGSLYLTRPTLGHHASTREATAEMAGELFELVVSGKILIDVGRSYPLEHAADAHRELEARTTTGSGVLIL
jgi:NADPH2:quinone reductase